MSPTLFAANWKMHHGPAAARDAGAGGPRAAPPARAAAGCSSSRRRCRWSRSVRGGRRAGRDAAVGAQNIHWEPKGAFTGEISAPLARDAGATWALVGHSERRHKFGETDAETGREGARGARRAASRRCCASARRWRSGERAQTEAVVRRQLEAGIGGPRSRQPRSGWRSPTSRCGPSARASTPRLPTRRRCTGWCATGWGAGAAAAFRFPILYGGSVSPDNAAALLAEPDLDGVLVGGASLTAESWLRIVDTPR